MNERRSNLYWRSPSYRGSARWYSTGHSRSHAEAALSICQPDDPLTVGELEAGLQMLDRMDTDTAEFWKENGRAFQATIRLAIRETAEALLIQRLPQALREELEGQLAWLTQCLIPKDRH